MEIGKYGYMFQWFEDEIKPVFGIDIYKYPFDKEKGYTIIKKGNVELLLMTMEKMNDNEEVVGNFVGIKEFKYTIENKGENKGYKYAYKELLRNVKIDDAVIDFYYQNNKYLDHFYANEQKEKFIKRWKKEN